jgi:hypothetical protein
MICRVESNRKTWREWFSLVLGGLVQLLAISCFYMRNHPILYYDIGQESKEGSDTDRYQIPPDLNPPKPDDMGEWI